MMDVEQESNNLYSIVIIITEELVFNCLRNIDTNKGGGPDLIPNTYNSRQI